jgi:hypothetical protein
MEIHISEASVGLIRDFAKSVQGEVECIPYKVTVRTSHVSIVFLQPEKWSRLLNCQFWLSHAVGFLYEDICAAFTTGQIFDSPPASAMLNDAEVMKRNERYVAEVLEFCQASWKDLIEVPPCWYEKAVEISDRSIRSHCPEIADEDLRNKTRLLTLWRTR